MGSPAACSMLVIYQEKWVLRHTRRKAVPEYVSARQVLCLRSITASAGAKAAASPTVEVPLARSRAQCGRRHLRGTALPSRLPPSQN
jgi:hypothetical protein